MVAPVKKESRPVACVCRHGVGWTSVRQATAREAAAVRCGWRLLTRAREFVGRWADFWPPLTHTYTHTPGLTHQTSPRPAHLWHVVEEEVIGHFVHAMQSHHERREAKCVEEHGADGGEEEDDDQGRHRQAQKLFAIGDLAAVEDKGARPYEVGVEPDQGQAGEHHHGPGIEEHDQGGGGDAHDAVVDLEVRKVLAQAPHGLGVVGRGRSGGFVGGKEPTAADFGGTIKSHNVMERSSRVSQGQVPLKGQRSRPPSAPNSILPTSVEPWNLAKLDRSKTSDHGLACNGAP